VRRRRLPVLEAKRSACAITVEKDIVTKARRIPRFRRDLKETIPIATGKSPKPGRVNSKIFSRVKSYIEFH
jgi:hypothetical protein